MATLIRARRTRPVILATALALLLGAAAAPPALAQTPTAASVRPEVSEAKDRTLTVEVTADGVSNLAGFQMLLSWDTGVLTYVDAAGGEDFLAGTGRKPYCPEPVVQEDVVRLACVTFAPPPPGVAPDQAPAPPPGVDGSGSLATFHFTVTGGGKTDLQFSKVELVDPDGNVLDMKMVGPDATVDDSGSSDGSALTLPLSLNGGGGSGLLWPLVGGLAGAAALVVGGGAVAFFLRRRRTVTLRDAPDSLVPGR